MDYFKAESQRLVITHAYTLPTHTSQTFSYVLSYISTSHLCIYLCIYLCLFIYASLDLLICVSIVWLWCVYPLCDYGVCIHCVTMVCAPIVWLWCLCLFICLSMYLFIYITICVSVYLRCVCIYRPVGAGEGYVQAGPGAGGKNKAKATDAHDSHPRGKQQWMFYCTRCHATYHILLPLSYTATLIMPTIVVDDDDADADADPRP